MKLIITDLENFPLPVEGEHKIIGPRDGIRHCIGCFGCWSKTPGKCVIHDGYESTGCDMGKCAELIFVSRCTYGSLSPFVKQVLDRAISYVQGDFVMRGGEMHHKRRYTNTIALSYHLYGGNITDAEKETAEKLAQAHADNFDGTVKAVCFYPSAEEMEGVAL